MRLYSWLLSLLMFAAFPAFADKCTDPIVDEENILSSAERTNIQHRVDALRAQNAEAHVQLLSSFHRNDQNQMMKSLSEYKAFMQAKCASWRAPDNGFKNNMVLVLVVPKKFTEGGKHGAPFGLFYGSQWTPKLAERFNGILDDMEGRFRDQKWAEGTVTGLTEVSDLISVTQAQVGKPIVINHSADYSGAASSAISWIFGLIFLAGLVFLVIFVLRKKGSNDTAQRSAQTERGNCSVYENGFETEFAGLKARIATTASLSPEWRAHLSDLLDRAQSAQSTASLQLSGLNRSSNNPDTPRLSQQAYTDMATRYGNTVKGYQEADRLLKLADSEFEKAKRGESISSLQSTQEQMGSRSNDSSQAPKNTGRMPSARSGGRSVPSTPAHVPNFDHGRDNDRTVVVQQGSNNDGLLTGILIGDMMSNHHRHDGDFERGRQTERDSNGPVIYQPQAPAAREGGGERNTSLSGEGGGGERFASLSGGGGGGERNAPPESSWSGGGSKTGY